MRSVYAGCGRGVASRRIQIALVAIVLWTPLDVRAQTPTRRNPARPVTLPKSATPSGSEQLKFKGIFEPVNYNQDLKLFDAFFVTADEGWVSGEKGTILHTSDGGKSWQAQLGGDPQSQGPDLKRLFFLDRRHGWAQSWNQLLRSSDGETWQEVGNDVRGDVAFVSPQSGFRPYGNTIYRTADGGATWNEAFTCRVRASVGGLARDLGCQVYALQFVSAKVGYGVGTSDENGSLVVKTADGGATWNVVSLALEPGDQRTFTLFFLDENNGFATRQTKLYRTSDGGKTWQGMMATLTGNMGGMAPPLKFADGEVGWSCVGICCPGFKLSYTLDSGKHWSSRELGSPSVVSGFSLPRRDTAYVVGEHGMVLRYRVVPANYQAVAHSIDGPTMPGFDSPVFGEFATLKDVVAKLRAKLHADSGDLQQIGGTSGNGANTPGGGSFQQDTGTGPVAGEYMDSCCGPLIQQLETTANSFATNVPTFSQRFRNLNLILEGLNLLNNIVNQANTLKQSIRALRRAPNQQAAAVALTNVQSQLNGISSSGGFVQDTSVPPQP